MKTNLMEEALLIGMVAGPGAAMTLIESANDDILARGRTSVTLPKPRDVDADLFRAWGITWQSDQSTDGGLTWPATIPVGWSIRRTEHWLYKHLVDGRGRARAQIMLHYQDHDSWLSPERMFTPVSRQDDYHDPEAPYFPAIVNGSKLLWRGAFAGPDFRVSGQACQEKAAEVLTATYPNWENHAAYWDLESFVFPPDESEQTPGVLYDLYTTYLNDRGDVTDSGSEPLLAVDDAAAIVKMEKRMTGSTFGRDIIWRLSLNGRKVARREKHLRIEKKCGFGGFIGDFERMYAED